MSAAMTAGLFLTVLGGCSSSSVDVTDSRWKPRRHALVGCDPALDSRGGGTSGEPAAPAVRMT